MTFSWYLLHWANVHAHWFINVDHFTTLTCITSTMATRSANETCSPAMKGLSWMNFSSMSFRELFRSSNAASSLSWGTSTPRTLGIKSYSPNIKTMFHPRGEQMKLHMINTVNMMLTVLQLLFSNSKEVSSPSFSPLPIAEQDKVVLL